MLCGSNCGGGSGGGGVVSELFQHATFSCLVIGL